jgi:hypothetical protein
VCVASCFKLVAVLSRAKLPFLVSRQPHDGMPRDQVSYPCLCCRLLCVAPPPPLSPLQLLAERYGLTDPALIVFDPWSLNGTPEEYKGRRLMQVCDENENARVCVAVLLRLFLILCANVLCSCLRA